MEHEAKKPGKCSVRQQKETTEAKKFLETMEAVIPWERLIRVISDTPLTKRDTVWNRRMNKIRARGEHIFLVVKKIFGYAKTRYRGLEKNACQLFTLFALANLYLVRKKLLHCQG